MDGTVSSVDYDYACNIGGIAGSTQGGSATANDIGCELYAYNTFDNVGYVAGTAQQGFVNGGLNVFMATCYVAGEEVMCNAIGYSGGFSEQ